MTDNIQLYQPTSQLMKSVNQTAITELANRLMKFPPNNKQLNQRDAAQLAVFSIMIDANPYANEVYPTPRGPMIGIPLYRRKAKEWNRAMSPSGEDWDYKVNFRLALDHEANFDPTKGDVAWVCELTDTKAEKEWQAAFAKFFNMLIEAKAPYDKADERALMMAGPRPVWTGTGVVGGGEHFSEAEVLTWENRKPKTFKEDDDGNPIYKQEMYDRNERAQKRAEKVALKKRYPDLIIPEFGEVQDSNMTVLIENAEGELVKAEEHFKERVENLDEKQALRDLGYEVEEDEILEGEMSDVDPLWDAHRDSIYYEVTDSKGTPYREKPIKSLSYSLSALNKKIAAFKEPKNEEELSEQTEFNLKRDAVKFWIEQKKE